MVNQNTFDLIIIGGGPGGYVAAVRATQLGLKTACIEKTPSLGGVCLNVGCIPSKALLDSSEYYHFAGSRLGLHGIKIEKLSLDLGAMMTRKERLVKELTDNVRKLLEANGVTIIHGEAQLAGENEVVVKTSIKGKAKRQTLQAKNILLATGSEPIAPAGLKFDGKRIVSSTEALQFESLPDHLGIVGGGYIGLELGSVWRRLGSRVTIIEMLPKPAAALDGQIGRALQRALTAQGFDFRLKTRVTSAKADADGVTLTLQTDAKEETLTCDRLLVAVGRRPLTRGLNLEAVGVKTDPKNGQVLVDASYRTRVSSIYAVGDLIAGPMLAHKASAEGVAAVEVMAGQSGEVNYDAIPAVIYTSPEVAYVGLTEEQVKERSIPYCSGVYPFSGNGRARAMGETEGFVKVLAHSRTDRVLGVHVIGPRASDMIAECVLAMELGASSEDIARTVHSHPTFSETLQEAALAVRKCAIHVP